MNKIKPKKERTNEYSYKTARCWLTGDLKRKIKLEYSIYY